MILPFPGRKFRIAVNAYSEECIDFAFEPAFFNTPPYIYFSNSGKIISFYLIRQSSGKTEGLVHFYLSEKTAISPVSAPFGSFETAPNLNLEYTETFIKTVLDYLKENNFGDIRIKHYPACYAPKQSALIINSLLHLNLQIGLCQVNHHIPVSDLPFENLIHSTSLRRLHKCRAAGFTFSQESPDFLPEAYAFMKACRIEKNKPISLTGAQMQALFSRFPENYLLFSIKKEEEVIALTIAVKVRKDVLLTAFPASPNRFNSFSPTVMLNAGLYSYCQENSIAILDYGISGVKEDPHYSLMKFKERLGGVPTLKFTFCKSVPCL